MVSGLSLGQQKIVERVLLVERRFKLKRGMAHGHRQNRHLCPLLRFATNVFDHRMSASGSLERYCFW